MLLFSNILKVDVTFIHDNIRRELLQYRVVLYVSLRHFLIAFIFSIIVCYVFHKIMAISFNFLKKSFLIFNINFKILHFKFENFRILYCKLIRRSDTKYDVTTFVIREFRIKTQIRTAFHGTRLGGFIPVFKRLLRHPKG